MNPFEIIQKPFLNIFNKIKSNPRYALATVAGFFILWLLLVGEMFRWGDDVEKSLDNKIAELKLLQKLSKEPFWKEKKEQAQEKFIGIEERLWPIQIEGLARATFQDYIMRKVEQSGLKNPSIRVAKLTLDKTNSKYVRIPAKIEADFSPQSMQKFFENLHSADRWIVVENFEVRRTNKPVFVATIAAIMPNTGIIQTGKKTKKGGNRL